jgi:hypothetical protein
MTRILDRLPPLPRTGVVAFGERHVTVFHDELLVWVSLGLRGEERLESLSPAFPALLDTGNNCDFYLHEHHLVHWAGIQPALLPVLGRKQINQQEIPCREADVWIYANEPGTHKHSSGKPPVLLEVDDGIAVAPQLPDQSIDPRLPLLGLPALRKNSLDFWFDSTAAHCYLRTADWRSKVIRFFQKF